jgi:adenosylmethionine-8-amino-7-oxononanoate aminotransferase
LIQNIKTQGEYLEKYLKSLLGTHPNVGDIRSRGFFWGVEFVRDKQTKEPFDPKLGIAQKMHDTAISAPFNMIMYWGTSIASSFAGDYVMLYPTYIINKDEIEHITKVTADVINQVFSSE